MAVHTFVGTAIALAVGLPPAAKWQLGLRRVTAALCLLGIAAGGAVYGLAALAPQPLWLRTGLTAALALTGAVVVLAYRFYRDPERTPPSATDVVVSPADGEVIYVRRTEAGRIPVSTKHGCDYTLEELTRTPLSAREAIVIGIGMSFLDVHVNRAPISGRVSVRRHFPGLFGSLRDAEMVFQNERATTVIERGSLQVAVVQIASRLVRQIASYVDEGETIGLGQRIGVIRLGSQVDVVLPSDQISEVLIQAGQRVRAGESILARLERSAPKGGA